MEQMKDNSSVGCQESNTKGWSHPSDEEGWKNSPLRELDGPMSLEERRTCETPPGIQEATCPPGGQRQRRRGIQGSIHRARCFSVSDGSGKILGHHLKASWYGAPRLLRMPKEECPEMWIRIPPRQIPTGGDNIEDPSGTSWKKLMWSPTGRPCLGKKIWRSDIRKRMGGKYKLGECLYVHKKLGFFSPVYVDDIKMVGKEQHNGPMCDNSAERNRPRISNASGRSSVFRLHAKRGNGWSSSSSFRNRLVQEIDDDKGGWRKKTKRKKNIRWKRSLLGATIWKRHAEKCVERFCEEAKNCIFSPANGNALHGRSPDTCGRLWDNWRCLQYVLRLFWNALYSASIGRTDFSWSVNTLARPVTTLIKQRTSYNSVVWGIRLKIANLVYSRMLHLQVTCEI